MATGNSGGGVSAGSQRAPRACLETEGAETRLLSPLGSLLPRTLQVSHPPVLEHKPGQPGLG